MRKEIADKLMKVLEDQGNYILAVVVFDEKQKGKEFDTNVMTQGFPYRIMPEAHLKMGVQINKLLMEGGSGRRIK